MPAKGMINMPAREQRALLPIGVISDDLGVVGAAQRCSREQVVGDDVQRGKNDAGDGRGRGQRAPGTFAACFGTLLPAHGQVVKEILSAVRRKRFRFRSF